MQCDQFEQVLIEQGDDPLPALALAHAEICEACRSLTADFSAIHDAALELGAEDIAVPERVWISLRNQLDAERLIHHPAPTAQNMQGGWWTTFQRPAMAGAFLSLILAAAALVGVGSTWSPAEFSYQSETPDGAPGGAPSIAVRSPSAPRQEDNPVLLAEDVFKAEAINVGDDLIPGFQQRDAAVTDSLRRNLGIVDNFINICEKSVHEEPDNQMAREYLYGAYQQKAELLATAMNRSVTGGLQ
jgi:hypothetical protein